MTTWPTAAGAAPSPSTGRRLRPISLATIGAALSPGAKTWRPRDDGGPVWSQHYAAPFAGAASPVRSQPASAAYAAPAPGSQVTPAQWQCAAMTGAQQTAAAVQAQAAAVVDAPPLLIYDRPESGQAQLAALCASSPHPLPLGAWTFSSVQHLYEAARFDPQVNAAIFAHVLSAPTAQDAKAAGQLYSQYRRSEWTEEKALAIMRAAIALRTALYWVSSFSPTRQLWEASDPGEEFWGVGQGSGRNEFGRILMDLRTRLQLERANGYEDVMCAFQRRVTQLTQTGAVLALVPPASRQQAAPMTEADQAAASQAQAQAWQQAQAQAAASAQGGGAAAETAEGAPPAGEKAVRFADA